MRTPQQLKILFAGLIALGTLTTVTAPAQVMGAGQSKSPAVVTLPPDARDSAQARRPAPPGTDTAERVTVSRMQEVRHNTRVISTSSSVSFLPVVSYNSGGYLSTAVAVADVNGDGQPDLVAANSFACPPQPPLCSTGTVGVLLGKGDGTFQAPVSYGSGGSMTSSVAVADVNGDGKPDIVVANDFFAGSVGVLLGNGDGTFQAAATYSSGGDTALSVAVADVNGDSKPDLLVANYFCGNTLTACVGVLLGIGDGTFQAVLTHGSGPEHGNSVAVADVNGDGKPDLLVGSTCLFPKCTDLAGVLLGNGDGTFQTIVTYNSGEGYRSSVSVSDVNGDRKPDLLVANLDSNTVGVMLGNGDGTFQAVVTSASGGDAESVAAADVNGDGKPDLLVLNEFCGGIDIGCVGVLLGNRDGTFQPAVTFSSGGEALGMAVANVNADGRPDVIVANYNALGVLLNNTPFCTTPPIVTLSATPESLWPPNGTMVPVTVSGTITDTGCTVTTVAYTVTDEYGEVQPSGPVPLGAGGSYSFTVLLQASRLGTDSDGRLYIISVSASNNAGQTGSQVARVTVPHDERR